MTIESGRISTEHRGDSRARGGRRSEYLVLEYGHGTLRRTVDRLHDHPVRRGLESATLSRLTFKQADNSEPSWSPALFETLDLARGFDVAADGQRILVCGRPSNDQPVDRLDLVFK